MSKKRRRRKRKQRERARRAAQAFRSGRGQNRGPSIDDDRGRDKKRRRRKDRKKIKNLKSKVKQLKEDRATSATQYSDLVGRFNSVKEDYEGAQEDLTSLRGDYDAQASQVSGLRDKIGNYEEQIGGFEEQISDYKNRFADLTSQYTAALANNATLTAERDEVQKRFQEQSAQYETAKTERDAYREAQVGEQLAGLRGGASAGGANQTSYTSGDLSSGRSGYSSSTQDRDKGLADYVMQEGGVTDSVLNREGPVVQLIGRRERRQAPRQARGRSQSMTSGAGTGSYYASRFGG